MLAPAFTELVETADNTLYFDGAARLLSEYRFQDVSQLNELLGMLERRVSLLGLLSAALTERDIYVRIGGENACPRCTRCRWWPPTTACRGATSARSRWSGRPGWTTACAIGTVREAAHQLSRFIEDVYEDR